ncbi:hypothetical protein, partial [Stieleria mannarensis]|uniref:hypothetical protein n=1 Tax=Stieleria mannarensis TaxID=2755585 RepID=UPI003F514FF6
MFKIARVILLVLAASMLTTTTDAQELPIRTRVPNNVVSLYGPTKDDWDNVTNLEKVTYLKVFDYSHISPSGSPQLDDAILSSQLAEYPNLRVLMLFAPHATDKIVETVSKMNQLQILVIGGARITDDGLAKLQRISNLKTLALWDTEVTNSGVKNLRRKNSRLSVETSGIDRGGSLLNRSGYPTEKLMSLIR